MFDVGFTEVLLLSLVGLLVLGPERLPRVARTLGGFARKARSSWANLKRSIDAELQAEDLKEPLKQFENEIRSGVDRVKSGVDNVKSGVSSLTDPPASPADKPDKSGKAEKPSE
jgi:sec-independent protein translocase protein TatB